MHGCMWINSCSLCRASLFWVAIVLKAVGCCWRGEWQGGSCLPEALWRRIFSTDLLIISSSIFFWNCWVFYSWSNFVLHFDTVTCFSFSNASTANPCRIHPLWLFSSLEIFLSRCWLFLSPWSFLVWFVCAYFFILFFFIICTFELLIKECMITILEVSTLGKVFYIVVHNEACPFIFSPFPHDEERRPSLVHTASA